MSDKIISWYSGFTEISELAKKKGYEVAEEEPVLSVKKADLLASDAVQKALRANFPGADVVAFSELWKFQFDDIEKLFQKFDINISLEELDDYDSDLSQAVFDDDGRLRALILVMNMETEVFVGLLAGASKETQFIMMAIKGFMDALGEAEDCENVSMLAASPAVEAMLKRALNKGYSIEEKGRVFSITTSEAFSDPELTEALEQAALNSVYQQNAGWKHPWSKKKKN